MSLTPHRSNCFSEDFDLQYRWYLREAGEAVAERYFAAVLTTVRELAQNPGLGRARRFRHEALWGLCSFRVMRPFQCHLLSRHGNRNVRRTFDARRTRSATEVARSTGCRVRRAQFASISCRDGARESP